MRARIGRAAFVAAAIGGMSVVGVGVAQAAPTLGVDAARNCDGSITVTGSVVDYEPTVRLSLSATTASVTTPQVTRLSSVGSEDAAGITYTDTIGALGVSTTFAAPLQDAVVTYRFYDGPTADDTVESATVGVRNGCTRTTASASRGCDGTVTLSVQGSGYVPDFPHNVEARVGGGPFAYDTEDRSSDAAGNYTNTVVLDYGQVGQNVDFRVFKPPVRARTVDQGSAYISDGCPTTNGSRILGTRDCATPDAILLGFDARGFADDTYTLRVTSPGFTALTGTDAALTAEYDIEGSIQGNDELGDPARVRISRAAVTAGYQLLASDGSVALAGSFELGDCGGDPGSDPDPGTGTGAGTDPGAGTGTGAGTVPIAGAPTTKPAPVASGQGTTPRALATTGSTVGSLALLGGGLVLAGGLAAAGARSARR